QSVAQSGLILEGCKAGRWKPRRKAVWAADRRCIRCMDEPFWRRSGQRKAPCYLSCEAFDCAWRSAPARGGAARDPAAGERLEIADLATCTTDHFRSRSSTASTLVTLPS